MPKTEKDYLSEAGNVHLKYYIQAADKLGIDYEVIIKSMTAKFTFENGKHAYINNTALPINSSTGCVLARRKNLAHQVLDSFNIPVPKQLKCTTPEDAIEFFKENKHVVLKPVQNLGGKGITILPESEDAIYKAYEYASKKDRYGRVLVEEYLHGDNYRLLALGDKVIGAVRRQPAHVLADGKHTVTQLIEIENTNRKEKGLMKIVIDQETTHKLKTMDLTLESIPEKDRMVYVRLNTNLTTGGTTEECMAEIHPYYLDIAVQTIKALDLEFGGVDLITTDITKPVKCGINEVNYNPGLRLHYKADSGDIVDVATPIMEYIRNRYTEKI